MVDRKIRVFVYETTSADPVCVDAALVSQGRSMRNAMLADLALLDDVVVTCAVASPPDPPLAAGIRVSCRTRRSSPQHYLRQEALVHDLVWVVAPETGGMLSDLRQVVADRQWLGCSSEAIAIATSKQATLRCLQAAGIATPCGSDNSDGRSDGSSDGSSDGGAWIVKPDDGCGTCDVRRHIGLADALADRDERLRHHQQATVEGWVEGEPLSITLLCSAERFEVLSLNRQRIHVAQDGTLAFDGVDIGRVPAQRQEQLAAMARRLREALPGLAGIVGVDLVWHPLHGPVVIEVNPRVTCAYPGLSAMLGRNVAGEMLAQHGRVHPGRPAMLAPNAA
jgi:tyramine---L-glutamate ligase